MPLRCPNGCLFQLLPRTFDVVGFEEGFAIEARSYGTRGPIDCEVDGTGFSCETQTAAVTRGEFYGFTYLIDFTGTVVDARLIEGSATVRYEVNEWLEGFLSNYDVVVAECPQVFALALRQN